MTYLFWGFCRFFDLFSEEEMNSCAYQTQQQKALVGLGCVGDIRRGLMTNSNGVVCPKPRRIIHTNDPICFRPSRLFHAKYVFFFP